MDFRDQMLRDICDIWMEVCWVYLIYKLVYAYSMNVYFAIGLWPRPHCRPGRGWLNCGPLFTPKMSAYMHSTAKCTGFCSYHWFRSQGDRDPVNRKENLLDPFMTRTFLAVCAGAAAPELGGGGSRQQPGGGGPGCQPVRDALPVHPDLGRLARHWLRRQVHRRRRRHRRLGRLRSWNRLRVRLPHHRLRAQPVSEAAALLVRHPGIRPVRGHGSVLFDDGVPAAVRVLSDLWQGDRGRATLVAASPQEPACQARPRRAKRLAAMRERTERGRVGPPAGWVSDTCDFRSVFWTSWWTAPRGCMPLDVWMGANRLDIQIYTSTRPRNCCLMEVWNWEQRCLGVRFQVV